MAQMSEVATGSGFSGGRRTTAFRAHAFGMVMAVLYVTALVATSRDLTMSRDESFYVIASESYAHWFELLVRSPGLALERENIDRFWYYNHEHPALMKTAFAITWLKQKHGGLFGSDTLAFRFPSMVSAGLLLWLICIFGTRVWNLRVGVFSAMAFALMPRIFYHSHLNCFDVPIVLMLTWVTYCYYRGLFDWRWQVMAGVAFGFALATKHNSWILPGVLLIHWIWWRIRTRRVIGPAQGWGVRLPWWLLSMATVGPLLFWFSWPWLWHDGWARFLWYARFHLEHVHYNIAYLGKSWFIPPFPVSYPWVLTAFTVPVTTLLLCALGLGRTWRRWLDPVLHWSNGSRGHPTPAREAMDGAPHVLMLGCFLSPLVVISLPSSPIFGGTKHWFAAYPFLALFAGVGFHWVCSRLRQIIENPAASRWLPWLVGAMLLLPSALETEHSHPFGLSHYNVLAGGVPGAADRGMNRQFWGFSHGPLMPWLRSDLLNEEGRVWPCDSTHKSWEMLHRDGILPPSISAERSMHRAHRILVHHEMHFIEVDAQAWMVTGHAYPEQVLTYDGVPIVSVYAHRE